MSIKPTPWAIGIGVPLIAAGQLRAEDSIGYTHETYAEDHGRMTVQTEYVRAHGTINPTADFTLIGVYDGISGATPIGAPAIDQLTLRDPRTHQPIPPSTITGFTRPFDGVSGASPTSQATSHTQVPLAGSHDIRRGLDLLAGFTLGPGRLIPEFSYSKEHDYVSYAFALNGTLDFNNKNTTLNAGWSHAYDQVIPNQFTYITSRQTKNTDTFILGLSQILTPRTIASANVTVTHEDGYLNDPYRSVVFDETDLDPNARVILHGEKRPSTRDAQAMLLSLTQAVPEMNASVEGTYRFYHDSYGITAHTLGAAWFQKFGTAVVVSPSFRYYRQTAADFYAIQFPGDPTNDPAAVPRFYSSDYRLSFLETFTVGVDATIKLHEHWELHLGYQRYWMRGLDHVTLQSTYPNAQIYTIGLNFSY